MYTIQSLTQTAQRGAGSNNKSSRRKCWNHITEDKAQDKGAQTPEFVSIQQLNVFMTRFGLDRDSKARLRCGAPLKARVFGCHTYDLCICILCIYIYMIYVICNNSPTQICNGNLTFGLDSQALRYPRNWRTVLGIYASRCLQNFCQNPKPCFML